jgi:tRNA G46 methylase TrmB
MVKFIVEYGKNSEPPAADGRLDGAAYHRNHEPIWAAISAFLSAQSGDVLEIGSGTGQHATEFARRAPQLNWWPSDIYDSHSEEHRRLASPFRTCKFTRAAANRPC